MPFYDSLLRAISGLIATFLLSSCASQTPVFVPPELRANTKAEQPWVENNYLVLAYHDVEDKDADQAYLSVSTDHLKQQFAWLRENHYQPITVDQILNAKMGGTPLPSKAVLLTFDDGYRSFYTRVLPLLKAYQWPAVLAPVGHWVDTPDDQPVNFGGKITNRERFLTWPQVKEISESGLVEIGSHTDNLHFGILANPQGNQQPAAATHAYNSTTGQYETDAEYEQRLRTDIARISEKLQQVTGKKPRVWVWPYGAASGTAERLVQEGGYKLLLNLGEGLAHANDTVGVPRMLVANDPTLEVFTNSAIKMGNNDTMRVVHVDLDYVYDPDPAQMERNLGAMVQRIADLQISTVFLQAYADPEGDGLVKSVYFPNRHLPMRADLFNRAAWQLASRTTVDVYAWMPVLSFDLAPSIARVTRWNPETGTDGIDPKQYIRLSPFDPEARRQITEIYEDLAKSSVFSGILYHDDALLSDFEDSSPDALAAYQAAGLPNSIAKLRADPATLHRWTRYKSRYLIDFTNMLTQHVRSIRGEHIRTARNIYAEPILNPESEVWFAQNLDDFLANYDWTAPMAMPLMEKIPESRAGAWLDQLVDAVASRPGALKKTVFEIQGHDWPSETGHPDAKQIPSETMARWLERLQLRGANNFGYYPDDFVQNQPRIDVIRPALSNAWYPWK
ncbi:MAG: poly-beta-1,6-N-acetyl-D-glucosamine N-deacetylase PgaB [Burkholderiaceae bacterium]|nr:poly-beta-1,6-N-acetyl-D-glucosamine N-deacetylase PgaB [Burkholderiaceae bacterium]